MPDEMFRPLEDGAVPPLAPAATVRARGDQRRARGRAAFAGTGALAVVLAFAGGYALVGGEQTDALRPPVAGTSPSPEVSPPAYDEDGCLIEVPTEPGGGLISLCVPSPAATPGSAPSSAPSAVPSDAASPRSSPTAAPRADDVLDALVTLQDADRAEPGDWADTTTDDDGPLLDPCAGGTAYPRDADRVARTGIGLTAVREAGGTDLRQTVARYSSQQAAGDAFDGYGRAVAGCPSTPVAEGPADSTVTHELVEASGAGAKRLALFRRTSSCPQCSGGYEYYAVQQVDDAVSVLVVGHGEDGDPGVAIARPFAAVAAERLVAAVRG